MLQGTTVHQMIICITNWKSHCLMHCWQLITQNHLELIWWLQQQKKHLNEEMNSLSASYRSQHAPIFFLFLSIILRLRITFSAAWDFRQKSSKALTASIEKGLLCLVCLKEVHRTHEKKRLFENVKTKNDKWKSTKQVWFWVSSWKLKSFHVAQG